MAPESKPTVDADDLDKQIEEMLGGPERVEGRDPAPPVETAATSPAPESAVAAPVPEPEPAKPAEPDRLTAALATIENLQRENAELRFATSKPQTPTRTEPSIEFENVLGRRVPKNREQRAIKVTAEDLIRLGWNDDPAKVIELMGNALFDFIVDVIPQITTQSWETRTRTERESRERLDNFWSAHPDLRDMQPFVATVEQLSLSDGTLSPQGLSQIEYNSRLGAKVREKVAAMRGLTLEQYMSAVSRPATAPTSTASRAVSTSGGAPSRSKSAAAGSQQAEIDDLLNNR